MDQLSSTADAPVRRARGAAEKPKNTEKLQRDSANARQWTIKGLTPETVEVSREAAKRSGMKLNSWIGQALEKAATHDSDAVVESPTTSSRADSFERIMDELVQLRAQGKQLETTVNSLSTILVKMLAEKMQSESR